MSKDFLEDREFDGILGLGLQGASNMRENSRVSPVLQIWIITKYR